MKAKITKWILIGISVLFLFLMLIMPLALVMVEAFGKGIESYLAAITDKYALKALVLTLEATFLDYLQPGCLRNINLKEKKC